MKPSPNEIPDATMSTLGPILSFNRPARMPTAPMTKNAREIAIDIVARDHPKSA